MGKIIYMEHTMVLLANSMNFQTPEQLNSFLTEGFTEQETMDGIIYYTENS